MQTVCLAVSSLAWPCLPRLLPSSLSPETSSCLLWAYIISTLCKVFTWKHCVSRGEEKNDLEVPFCLLNPNLPQEVFDGD